MASPYPRFRCALILVLLAAAATPRFSTAGDLRPFEHHVRTSDPLLRALIRHGVDTSPSFRALVDHLTRTDVIVYVETQFFQQPGLEGMLTFLTQAGGVRYVRVQVACDRSPQRQLATIAHELQHATEVAQMASIVDADSMAQAFGHVLGFETAARFGQRRFESAAAIEAGQQVWREYVFTY